MKKVRLFASLLAAGLLLAGCGSAGATMPEDVYSYSDTRNSGALGNFSLLTPITGYSSTSISKFTWEESQNAEYYALEICDHEDFDAMDPNEVYVKKTNISTTSYVMNSFLPNKNTTYYWRVTAFNKGHSKLSDNTLSFYYEAEDVSEVKIAIEDVEDFTLHKDGSFANVSIDKSNFFGNDENSLAITFDKEHTNQGIASSDGWMVITKTEENDLYGLDSLYFNFYYSGNDANVLIRFVDNDGEYWHCPIQISNNAKQTVLMKFSDFELRTRDTMIVNQRFDYEHIRYFEIVFEKAFGDGVCLISNVKAVKYSDFSHLFINKLDFRQFDKGWTYDNYHFGHTISESGDELTLTFNSGADANNPDRGMGVLGWGFVKIPLETYFGEGNAVKVKVRYNGSGTSSSNFLIRILEEDNDRWQYKQTYAGLSNVEFTTFIIPFRAFTKTDYINGDGNRQFYFIKTLQFGINNVYGSGSVSIKDFEIVTLDKEVNIERPTIGADGIIDNFDSYTNYSQMYYYWDLSTDNKDEAMMLETSMKTGGLSNKAAARFEYKSDMGMATYSKFFNTSVNTHNALSLWLKDGVVIPDNAFADISKVSTEVTIQLSMVSGEYYQYHISALNKEWREYIISFSDFTCINGDTLLDGATPLVEEKIVNFGIGFQYFFKTASGAPYPIYTSSNPVYIDEIKLVKADSSSVSEIESTLKPSPDNENICYVDDMEYGSNDAIFNRWQYGSEHVANSMTLSNDVSSKGGKTSLEMAYMGSTSVRYVLNTSFSENVKARSLSLDIKGDDKATVYINIYYLSGTTLMQYRATLSAVESSWNRYVLGFSLFQPIDCSGSISYKNVPSIQKITFGIVGSSTTSSILVDNITLDYSAGYSTNTKTAL